METPPVTSKKTLESSLKKTSLTPCRRMGLSRRSSSNLKRFLPMTVISTPKQSSSSALNPDLRSVATSDEKPEVLDCEERLKVPLKTSDVLNEKTVYSARRCLSVTPAKSKVKRTLPVDCSEIGISHKSDDLGFELGLRKTDVNCESQGKRKKLSMKVSDQPEHGEETCKLENVYDPTTCSTVSSNDPTVIDNDEEIQDVSPESIHQLVLSIRNKQKKLEQLKVQETYTKKHNLSELRLLTEQWRTAGREALRYSMSLASQAGYSVTLKQLMDQHGFPPHLMGYNEEDDEFD